MAPPAKRKAEGGPLGAPNKTYRQGKLFSFFCKKMQPGAGTGTGDGASAGAAGPKAVAVAAAAPSSPRSDASPAPAPTIAVTTTTTVAAAAAAPSVVSGTATPATAAAPSGGRPRRRIQDDDDDDEGEAEFRMPNSDSDGGNDDDESSYEDHGPPQDDEDDEAMDDVEDEPEEEEEDQWIVSEEEEDDDAPKRRGRGRGTLKRLKVTPHSGSGGGTATTTPARHAAATVGAGFGPKTPKHVTPAASSQAGAGWGAEPAQLSPPIFGSPALTSAASPSSHGAPPMYQRDVVNPAGAHVHHHLRFLRRAHRRDAAGRGVEDPDHDPRTLRVDRAELERRVGKLTDGVKQWWDLKAQYFDTVLLFKTGKFYELFHMDADVGVQVCGHCYMKGHVAHSGFPEAAYGKFADMMVRAGYKVCRVEQTETPDQLKERKKSYRGKAGAPKVVNREVCGILTAGTRTYCVLDRLDDAADALSAADGGGVGPLLAIRECLLAPPEGGDASEVQPVCEYGITLVDAVRGVVTVGQFADDVLRSRMDTLLMTYQPSEILLQGGADGASSTLRSLVQLFQKTSRSNFRVETVRTNESFPKSNATDPEVRRQLERRSVVRPWDAQETLEEIHRRGYYPRVSKDADRDDVSCWPRILRALVEGHADLAISSFGAALYHLQRNLIDMELLTMGIVKAYVPAATSVEQEKADGTIGKLAAQAVQAEGATEFTDAGGSSLGTSTHYDQDAVPMNISVPNRCDEDEICNMALDGTTLMNLEILSNNADNKPNGSLWSLINNTKTPHGNRLLRAWLLRPLFRKADIDRRTDAVQELVSGSAAAVLSEATSVLSKCCDIERLLSRVHSMGVPARDGLAGASVATSIHPNDRAVLYETATYTRRMVSDFSNLLNGLRQVDSIPEIFDKIEIQSGLLNKIVRRTTHGGRFPDMTESLDWFFDNFDCEKASRGQFEPARGIDADYDASCETIERILGELETYRNEMCARHLSPATLVRSSWKYVNTKPDSKDKYLIELPSTVAVPEDFLIKGKRGSGAKQVNKYRTPFVGRLVQELDNAYEVQNQRRSMGMKLIFCKFDSMRHLWAAAGQATALLDALGSLAKASMNAGYSRAKILDCPSGEVSSISVVQGRHPIVEKTLKTGEFVPNDLTLGSNGKRILLLSGVNMGGKSTCLRQTCLLAILAQIGCFVPAESFELTPVDRIYTRLGASDRILMGQSTFFVELAENAAALRGATRRSLVIMDELGRGTSTFDGTAIASATVKHLVERAKCISLFATHYHSLLDEWQDHPNVLLGHMECVVENGNETVRHEGTDESTITFLYTLGEGIFPKSFGINVARLAGLPSEVLSNAYRISSDFEREMNHGASSTTITAAVAKDVKRRYEKAKRTDEWENELRKLMAELTQRD